MAERCQVCGRSDGCRSYNLAGDYPVLLCHPCINTVIHAMHKMPEFREWFVCERSMDAAAVAGLSAEEIRKRAGEYFAAVARLRAAVSAMMEKLSVFANHVKPLLSKEDAEIIQHEVDQLPPVPVKPAKVYALASLGRVHLYSQIELHGVYTSLEARDAAKVKIAAEANQEARQDGTAPLEFTWYTWEGVPMEGEKRATDPLDDIRQWIKANIPAAKFEGIILEPVRSPIRSRVDWVDHKGKECLDHIPSHIKWPADASLEVIGHDACMKWLYGDTGERKEAAND